MPSVISLPSDKAQREAVVFDLITEGNGARNPQVIRWSIANLYLQGVRNFSNVNYNNGQVSVAYENEAGILQFRYDDIVSKYQSQLGRLLALDLSPHVRRRGISLDGMRKASVAQVVLDVALPEDKIERFKLDLCPTILMYGTAGVGRWTEGPDSHGLEVIPPWQLLPLPLNISGPNDVRGLIRVRPVPLDWVKNLQITPGGRSKDWKGLDEVSVAVGHLPVDMESMGEGILSMAGSGGGFFVHTSDMQDKDAGMASGKGKKKDEKNVPITQLVEVWTETSDGYLGTYAIYAGVGKLKELYIHDHTAHRYPMPVRVIRDIPTGSFWGRSYVDTLIPLNHEIELALSSIFQAVNDFDLYGLLLWPTNLGDSVLAERGQDGIKRIRYERDYTSPEMTPTNIEPAKMTTPFFQAVSLASTLNEKIANQPTEMMSGGAPGRVDSSAGLGFLYETSGIPLTPTAKNIAGGVSGVYRSLLRYLRDTWTDQKVVDVTSLDDSLAGIVLDAESGQLSLSMNAIPMPEEVDITISSEVPVSKAKEEAELKEALKDQRITQDEFNFEVRKRGLAIPVGDEVGWQNYRRAMLENIVLFGDGETPGKVTVSPYDLPRVHLDTLMAFVARPEFFAASVAVREAFYEHIKEHRGQMGMYPDQLPYAEDSAEAMLSPQQLGIPQQQQPM
jgi:hypothetical protein